MSERDFTPEEIEALEELADLSESDPVLFEQTIREGVVEAEQREHGEALLAMFDTATERREQQGREFLEMLHRAHQAKSADANPGGDHDLGGDAA